MKKPVPSLEAKGDCAGHAQHPAYGYMRRSELKTIVPFSDSTLWRHIRSGKFVKPVRLSARITAWSRVAVYAWLKEQEGK